MFAGQDEPVIDDTGGALTCAGTRFLAADHQGSIVAQADCSGNRQAVNSYDEYGIPAAGNTGRFQYTGQAWLPELGIYYYKARMYSPTLGRFLQTDPIDYKDQVNLYAYVGNDPLNKRDPSGTDAIVVVNPDGTRTLIIPVMYTGPGANPTAIAQMANSITVINSRDTIKVVPTTTPIQGIIDRMDINPTKDYKTYPTAGEG